MKTLQEIQEENRRLILEVISENVPNETYSEAAVLKDSEWFGIPMPPLTLSRVLLALTGKIFSLELNYAFCESPKLEAFEDNDCDDPNCDCGGRDEVFSWDLTKETLESQSEEIQTSINKLLTE